MQPMVSPLTFHIEAMFTPTFKAAAQALEFITGVTHTLQCFCCHHTAKPTSTVQYNGSVGVNIDNLLNTKFQNSSWDRNGMGYLEYQLVSEKRKNNTGSLHSLLSSYTLLTFPSSNSLLSRTSIMTGSVSEEPGFSPEIWP